MQEHQYRIDKKPPLKEIAKTSKSVEQMIVKLHQLFCYSSQTHSASLVL